MERCDGRFYELCAYAFVSAKTNKNCFRLFSDLKINKFMKTEIPNNQPTKQCTIHGVVGSFVRCHTVN